MAQLTMASNWLSSGCNKKHNHDMSNELALIRDFFVDWTGVERFPNLAGWRHVRNIVRRHESVLKPSMARCLRSRL